MNRTLNGTQAQAVATFELAANYDTVALEVVAEWIAADDRDSVPFDASCLAIDELADYIEGIKAAWLAHTAKPISDDLDAILTGYMDAVDWAEYVNTDESSLGCGDEGGHPLDREEQWEKRSLAILAKRVKDALEDFDPVDYAAYIASGRDPMHFGHDLYLTTHGHGAGFWDRGLGALGDRLSAACGRDETYIYIYRGRLRIDG